mmetsp:Transcript_13023/g.19753  ORF Transcript_13023/g.19753 Transcript_13023/m.19753 type:complete len:179 (+) Transcript_13023:3-539(+)
MDPRRSRARVQRSYQKACSWHQQTYALNNARAQAMRASVQFFSPPMSFTYDSNVSNFKPEPGSAPFVTMPPVYEPFPSKMAQQFRLRYSPQQETVDSADIEANPLPDSPQSTTDTAAATGTAPAMVMSPPMSVVSEGGYHSSMQRKRTETQPLNEMGEDSDLYINADHGHDEEQPFVL